MVFAFRAKAKSFDFPICASLQASTENVLNITPNTQLGKEARDGKFQPQRNFFFGGGVAGAGGGGSRGGGGLRGRLQRRKGILTLHPERPK